MAAAEAEYRAMWRRHCAAAPTPGRPNAPQDGLGVELSVFDKI